MLCTDYKREWPSGVRLSSRLSGRTRLFFIVFHRIPLTSARFYLVFPLLSGLYLVLPGLSGLYLVLRGCFGFYLVLIQGLMSFF